MPKIAGQPVGYIDGGGGESVLDEPCDLRRLGRTAGDAVDEKPRCVDACGMARTRSRDVIRIQQSQAGVGVAQCPGDIDAIADSGAASQ